MRQRLGQQRRLGPQNSKQLGLEKLGQLGPARPRRERALGPVELGVVRTAGPATRQFGHHLLKLVEISEFGVGAEAYSLDCTKIIILKRLIDLIY